MTTTTAPRRLVSMKDVADQIGMTERSVRNLVARGELPAYRIGARTLRIDQADLDQIIRPVPTVQRGDAA